MPTPVKPCVGRFSELTIQLLVDNEGRAQWLPQPCELCGQQVGARLERGKWLPEPHWPSVRSLPRNKRTEKRPALQPNVSPRLA